MLKMVKKLQPEGEQLANGNSDASSDYVGTGEDQVKAFDIQDVVDLDVANVQLTAKAVGTNGMHMCILLSMPKY